MLAFPADPQAGAKQLERSLVDAGVDPRGVSQPLLDELVRAAQDRARMVRLLDHSATREQRFVESCDWYAKQLARAMAGDKAALDPGTASLLRRHGLA